MAARIGFPLLLLIPPFAAGICHMDARYLAGRKGWGTRGVGCSGPPRSCSGADPSPGALSSLRLEVLVMCAGSG